MGHDEVERITTVIKPRPAAVPARRKVHDLINCRSAIHMRAFEAGYLVSLSALLAVIILHFTDGISGWWIFAALAAALGVTGAVVISLLNEMDRRDRREFIELDTLEEPARGLLCRARQAISAVSSSNVYGENLLVHTVEEKMLRQHEREIASALRDISRLRAELERSTGTGTPGPRTAAVMASQRHALDLATNATTSRIKALERYSEELAAADAAKRDWQSAVTVSGRNHQYLDLVARTAADEHASLRLPTGLSRLLLPPKPSRRACTKPTWQQRYWSSRPCRQIHK